MSKTRAVFHIEGVAGGAEGSPRGVASNAAYARYRSLVLIALCSVIASFFAACHTDMYEQPRYEPLEPSNFFRNGMSSQAPPAGTVARGSVDPESMLVTGRENGALSNSFPFAVTPAVMARGQERYNIYCLPCHGVTGEGDGTVVARGFKRPTSFQSAEFRAKPVGHIIDVIHNGFGVMYDYRAKVAPKDRWAIAAYIRALQLSQKAQVSDLPEKDRKQLQRIK